MCVSLSLVIIVKCHRKAKATKGDSKKERKKERKKGESERTKEKERKRYTIRLLRLDDY